MLFNIWIGRAITPLGRITVLKPLILSKIFYLVMLLPNSPDSFTDNLKKKKKKIFQYLVKCVACI